jgi:O-antigen biosynthesis protein
VQVSFIIPLYNCLSLTQAMVASLRATLPAGLTHEIILVDDGSTDGTREWLKDLSSSTDAATPPTAYRVLLNERNLGYAAANNRAAAVATGEFLALLNNDLVLTRSWLEPMLAAHRTCGSRAGLVGNVQLDARTGAIDHAGIFFNFQGKPEHVREVPLAPSRFLRPVARVEAVTGACMLVSRALWTQLGGFDEGYVNGCEDVDLCLRAQNAGRVNLVALRSVVRHHVSSSLGRKLRDEENTFRFTRLWQTELLRRAVRHWCRHYYETCSLAPRDAEYGAAFRIWLHAIGLLQNPPREALAGIEAAMGVELGRWEKMFSRPVPAS